MKKGKLFTGTAILVFMAFLIFSAYVSGCGGGGGGGGGGGTPVSPTPTQTVSPTTSPTTTPSPSPSPTGTPGPGNNVSGYVRDENGLPIQGATVGAVQKGLTFIDRLDRNYEATTDANGQFSVGDIPYSSFSMQVEKSGRKTVNVDGFTSTGEYEALSLTQPAGSGEVNVTLPSPVTLSASVSGSDANLSWSGGQSENFVSYMVMRSKSSGVNILSNNAGKFTSYSTTSMTDKNLSQGICYYRVFEIINSDGGHLAVGSNEVSVNMSASDAFPDNIAMLMMKTLPAAGGGYEHQARYVVTTTDISGIIPQGKTVMIVSPFFAQSMQAQYAVMGYKKVKHYYYGNPAHYLGEIGMPGEWESKYFVSKDDFAADERIGTHRISIDGSIVGFGNLTTAQPESKILNPQVSLNADGDIELTWNMVQDGASFSGGAGSYGWKYFIKVMQEAGAGDSTYQYEKFWSNICIRDIGFNRICEVSANIPQVTNNKVVIPGGIFESGTAVKVSLYAISTSETTSSPTTGADGYGKSFMYWLYQGGSALNIP
ncbi:MAG: carboxypeptidase-like regulatory domain-containing protein [Candidatus Eremiobacteraeota bacterium]|nr:carboxypeptidase-like regulatory domain-containing protein [Candidatus Eremiobacteraeota bacterium]